MMPEEWPIAALPADANVRARGARRSRLATVRADFFLDPAQRLTEQERALMTAMLHCLVSDMADELRASLPIGWAPANDGDNGSIVQALSSARLLDEPGLMALLLRRADEERIASAARARAGKREARVLQGLVSHQDGGVSAAAMALILARGRRRDRFAQCLVSFDDLPLSSAEALVHSIAAALRRESAAQDSRIDSELSDACRRVIAAHEPDRSLDSLTAELARLLEESGEIEDSLLLAAAQEGEIGFVADVFARRGGVPVDSAVDELVSGDSARTMALLRMARCSRELAAGMLAGVGDLLGITDPGAAIGIFEGLTEEQVSSARAWLLTPLTYRSALDALGIDDGQRSV